MCLNCQGVWAREALDFDQTPLYCYCGGLIKPDVVFFGEAIPEAAMRKANALVLTGDLVLIIGSSMEVAPINLLPQVAKENGAIIVESNTGAHPPDSIFLPIISCRGRPGRCGRR